MDYNYSRGRPFGGQAWILNSKLDIVNHEFFNRHLSYIHLKKNETEYMIVGAYMPFDNSKKRDDSLSSYELTLSLITTLINKAKTLNIPLFIVGDFNADTKRNNRFDKILNNFINDHNINSLVYSFPQPINFTYKATLNLKLITATIDHAFFIPYTDQIIIKNCTILDDIANMSDHNAISINFKLKLKKLNLEPPQNDKKPYKTVNFENPIIRNFYNSAIETQLDYSNDLLPGPNNSDPQNSIDKYHLFISEIINKAENETIIYQQIIEHKPGIQNRKITLKNCSHQN